MTKREMMIAKLRQMHEATKQVEVKEIAKAEPARRIAPMQVVLLRLVEGFLPHPIAEQNRIAHERYQSYIKQGGF